MAHVVVAVLGDVGRSPRMQYHACSLANLSSQVISRVTLLGYDGEKCVPSVVAKKNIFERRISLGSINGLKKIPILHTVYKGFHLIFALVRELINLPAIDLIIIQNPPGLPLLLAMLLLKFWMLLTYLYHVTASILLLRAIPIYKTVQICIDWHNLGFSIYKQILKNERHPLVIVSYYLEQWCSGIANIHLCVSQAMKVWLCKEFNIPPNNVIVLYDRPPIQFKNAVVMSPGDRHQLLLKLELTVSALFDINSNKCKESESTELKSRKDLETTIQTIKTGRKVALLDDNTTQSADCKRCMLILSSTSWTEDEDFDILVNAVIELDKWLEKRSNTENPRIVVGITGKGPLKSLYEERFAVLNRELEYCRFKTLWLEPEDYPMFVSCADIGVCLHTSSSGIDLPMKVLDMLGAGVPVCAVEFPALPELVKHRENGIIFRTSAELTDALIELLLGTVDTKAKRGGERRKVLQELRDNAKKIKTWEENWTEVLAPVITSILKR